jgi:hypothetical protein
MDSLVMLHSRLVVTILLFLGAMALWGGFNYLRGQSVSGSYLGALVIGELLLLAEFILGLITFIGGRQPYRPSIHILYGIVAIIMLPGTFAYIRGRDSRFEQLIYAVVCLFLCGIALRSLETGRLPGS